MDAISVALRTEAIAKVVSNPNKSSNETFIVTLESGTKAIWKPIDKRYRNEIAAYLVDRRIGFGMVPVTVERIINGRPGSLQLYCESIPAQILSWPVKGIYGREARQRITNVLPVEIEKRTAFDFLIKNPDRAFLTNWLLAPDGRIICIDHEQAFHSLLICPNCKTHNPQHEFKVAEYQHCQNCKWVWELDPTQESKVDSTALTYFRQPESSQVLLNLKSLSVDLKFHTNLAELIGEYELGQFLYRIEFIIGKLTTNA